MTAIAHEMASAEVGGLGPAVISDDETAAVELSEVGKASPGHVIAREVSVIFGELSTRVGSSVSWSA